jgi:hypothetical protein
MLHNTVTDKNLTLYCLVDGESTMNAFPVPISSAETVGELKDKIKTKKAPRFDDVAADELSLWRVSIPDDDDDDDDEIPIVLGHVNNRTRRNSERRVACWKSFQTSRPKTQFMSSSSAHLQVM